MNKHVQGQIGEQTTSPKVEVCAFDHRSEPCFATSAGALIHVDCFIQSVLSLPRPELPSQLMPVEGRVIDGENTSEIQVGGSFAKGGAESGRQEKQGVRSDNQRRIERPGQQKQRGSSKSVDVR